MQLREVHRAVISASEFVLDSGNFARFESGPLKGL